MRAPRQDGVPSGKITLMKKYLKYIFISLAILIGSVFACQLFGGYKQADSAYPGGIKKVPCLHANNISYSSGTPAYLLATAASSTCVIDISHAKNLSLGIFLNSSTTATNLNFFLASSVNDGISANTGTTTDWYRFKINSDSGSVRTWNTGSVANVVPFSSSTRFHLIPVTDLRGNFLRVDYGVTGAAANVAIEAYEDID